MGERTTEKSVFTPIIPFMDRSCCNGSNIWFGSAAPKLGRVPRMTAFHTRNSPSGMAEPRTIAVLNWKQVTQITQK